MRKYICDICHDEDDKHINVLDIPCHQWSKRTTQFTGGFVDNDFNAVSGRKDHIDLCNSCYNIAWGAASKALINKREELAG